MKKNLIIAVIFSYGCALNKPTPRYNIEHAKGVVSSNQCEKIDYSDSYPIKRDQCGSISVTRRASHVPIYLGAQFGVEYLIKNLDRKKCYMITHKLIHPAMLAPNGEKRSDYSRSMTAGQCQNGKTEYRNVFSWFVEEEWEAVKGEWSFIILVDNSVAVSEKIIAY